MSNLSRTLALLALGTFLLATAAQAQSSDEAKNILRRSREKCQSIQQGHYVMLWKMKYMSDKDTTFGRCTCDFKKLPKDTVYGKTFSQFEDYGNSSRHFLYTGNEFVSYGDTAGTVMKCDQWADKIIAGRHNRTFYTPLTEQNCHPLPGKKWLADSDYIYSLSETLLDGKPCYRVTYFNTNFEPDTVFGITTIRYEVNIWIDKENYLPVQYTEVYDNVEGQDTTCQYELCRLLEFSLEIDKSKLTMKSIPASVKLKDYEPYKAPEPLAEGTPAPDWALPTLMGDTVSLADLRGKIVLLDFFYKHCAPCCAALPFLQNIHEKYKDQGVVLLGVDPIDDPVKDEMADFLAKRGITYTILFSDRQLSQTYHIAAYPTLFFIDRDGKIAKVHHGYHPSLEEALEEQLLKML